MLIIPYLGSMSRGRPVRVFYTCYRQHRLSDRTGRARLSPMTTDLVPSDPGTLPGSALTPAQRAVAEAMIIDGLSKHAAAEKCHIPYRTVRDWCQVDTRGFNTYLNHLLKVVMADVNRQVRAKAAASAPRLFDKVVALAEGTAEPASPYQDRYVNMVLERVAPKPQPSVGTDVALEVPTPRGPVRIVFRSRAVPDD